MKERVKRYQQNYQFINKTLQIISGNDGVPFPADDILQGSDFNLSLVSGIEEPQNLHNNALLSSTLREEIQHEVKSQTLANNNQNLFPYFDINVQTFLCLNFFIGIDHKKLLLA